MIFLIHLLEHLGVPSGAAAAIAITGTKLLKGRTPKTGHATAVRTATAAKDTRMTAVDGTAPVTGVRPALRRAAVWLACAALVIFTSEADVNHAMDTLRPHILPRHLAPR